MTYAIYVTSNREYGFINQKNFEILRAGTIGEQLTDIAVDIDGNIFAVGFRTLYKVELDIGESGISASLITIGTLQGSASFNALEFNDKGQLFTANAEGFFEVDTQTASLNLIAPLPSASAGDIVFNQRTDDYYIAARDGSIYQWNEGAGAVIDTGFDVPESTYGLTIVNDVLHSFYSRDVKQIDLITGAENTIFNLDVSGSIWGTSAVPAQAAETIARLYLATFDRVPDAAGLQFWINVYRNDMELNEVARLFAQSEEFQQRFGTDIGNEQFVDVIYQNVLGRPGESDGVVFWRDALETGSQRADLLLFFADSAENRDRSEDIVSSAIGRLDPLAVFANYLETA